MPNQPKHTPGPWRSNRTNPNGNPLIEVGEGYGENILASVWSKNVWDARLITASLNLLAALKAWVEAEQDSHFAEQAHDPEGCRYCESVAAIAEAEDANV